MMAVVVAATVALSLPDNFSPELNLLYTMREGKHIHQARQAVSFAQRFVENGTPEDIALAVKVLEAAFQCQERREDDLDHSNFWWYYEDRKVTDRNGARFLLSSLIPMMLEHEDWLPEPTRRATRNRSGSRWKRSRVWM